jgi:hypothetical protein
MGSFSLNCCVSNLPIGWNTPVRFFLLAPRPSKSIDLEGHNPYHYWFPRTWPIKATYDDSGSIEKAQSKYLQKIWLDTLKADMVEKDLGENKYHDVPVRKNMSFEDMLLAVWENRLEIKVNNNYVINKFDVDMHELVSDEKDNSILIQPAMIREDVWQEICKLKIGSYRPEILNIDEFKKMSRKAVEDLDKEQKLEEFFLKNSNIDCLKDGDYFCKQMELSDSLRYGFSKHFIYNSTRFVLGLGSSFRLVCKRFNQGKITQKQFDEFIDSAAEFIFIEFFMQQARIHWLPSSHMGDQCGDWLFHKKIHETFQNIADNIIKKEGIGEE